MRFRDSRLLKAARAEAEALAATKDPALEEKLAKAVAKRQAAEARIATHVALVQARATQAAKRLLEHRDPMMPMPKTREDLIALVEQMARTPRKYGAYLTAAEKRAIAEYHALYRMQQEVEAKAGPS